jgi:outer membrane autotransporter protein
VQHVSTGGVANQTSIFSSGVQHVSIGGDANQTHIFSGGSQYVYSGGRAIDTNISGGEQHVFDGTADGTTVDSGGTIHQYSAGSVSNLSMVSGKHILDNVTFTGGSYGSGTEQHIRNGGSASGATIDGGIQYVSTGTASGTTVNSGGELYQYVGGVVSNLSMNSGTHYLEGASHYGGIYTSGTSQVVNSGGTATGAILNGGLQYVSSGTADGTTVDSGGSQVVNINGLANNAIVNSGSQVLSGGSASGGTFGSSGSQVILDNGTATGAILNGGVQYVSSGTADGTTVDSGGSMVVYSGGVASNATITVGTLTASGNDVFSGAFELGSSGVMNILATSQTITKLTGYGVTSIGTGGQLTLNQSMSTAYNGTIDGSGGTFIKDGAGDITLTKSNNSVGLLAVSGGGVIIASGGSISAASGATVYGSGWLGGGGTLAGGLSISSGGLLAPAGSGVSSSGGYTTLTVSGNLTFDAGAVYQVRVDKDNAAQNDLVAVSGGSAMLTGASVSHLADSGDMGENYVNKQWTILTADNLVGTFDSAATNLAFFDALLGYDKNNVFLSFRRTFDYKDYASTYNQFGVAGGLSSLEAIDPGNPLIQSILNNTTSDTAVTLLNQLSGDMHASLPGGLMLLDRDFSRWILDRSGRKSLARTILSGSVPAFESAQAFAAISLSALESHLANNFWVDVGYARQSVDGDGNAGRYTLKGPEVSLGYDHIAPSGWLGGVAFRYGDRKMKVNSRLSEADVDSYSLAAYGGFQTAFGPGEARLVLGGVYTRHNIDGKRYVDIGAVRQRLESDYHANSHQLFMEGAYAIPMGAVWLEPFVDLAWTSMRVPGFTERGGAAALRTQSHSQNNLSQLLGLRLVSLTICRVNVEALAGWHRTYGKLDKAHSFNFAEGGGRFGIKGGRFNRDEAVFDIRADYEVRENLRLGLEANAAVGERDNSLRGGAFIAIDW